MDTTRVNGQWGEKMQEASDPVSATDLRRWNVWLIKRMCESADPFVAEIGSELRSGRHTMREVMMHQEYGERLMRVLTIAIDEFNSAAPVQRAALLRNGLAEMDRLLAEDRESSP